MRIPITGGRFLLAASAVAWLALSAGARPVFADQVSGNVTLGGRPAGNATLVFRAAQSTQGTIEVRTSDTGFYRVFLEPGRYKVNLKDHPGDQEIESLHTPVTRNLVF